MGAGAMLALEMTNFGLGIAGVGLGAASLGLSA